MEPLIRRATAADVDHLVELRSDFTFGDVEPGDVRHGFGAPTEPLIWEPRRQPPKQPT